MSWVNFFFVPFILSSISSSVIPNRIHGRIVGGKTTSIQEFPYQVAILHQEYPIFCGGTIITSNHILTAAHCLDEIEPEDLLIRAGSSHLDKGGQVFNVCRIYRHQNFNLDTLDFDIAVLQLVGDLEFGNSVAPIELPYTLAQYKEGTPAIATGWGRMEYSGQKAVELQEVLLPILKDKLCKEIYFGQITDTMFCAGYKESGKDTCQGDSGGPLVGNGVLLGITSWGDGCGAMNKPGVFTNVMLFTNFIYDVLKSERQCMFAD